jgi:2-iminobutanoate/2-iminopropanoate deaminase
MYLSVRPPRRKIALIRAHLSKKARLAMAVKQSIRSPKVGDPPPQTWSNCLVVGSNIYVAGMTATVSGEIKGGDSMYEQAKVIFTKIHDLLEAAGATMNDIVKLNIFVIDVKQREEVWKARREFFTGDFPVSTLVEVTAVGNSPENLVEIEAQAILGAGQP